MSLKNYKAPTVTVPLDGENSFEVRGLSLEHLIETFKKHTEDMEAVFKKFMDEREEGAPLTVAAIRQLAEFILLETPKMAYQLIAQAANEPDAADVVKTLRFPVQVDALLAIAELTITSEAELKKLVEAVTKAINRVTSLIAKNKTIAPAR